MTRTGNCSLLTVNPNPAGVRDWPMPTHALVWTTPQRKRTDDGRGPDHGDCVLA
jgi:hypothetical protein